MAKTISLNEINELLKKRVSSLNAKLLLNTAVNLTGISVSSDAELTKEQLADLAMKMINQGGPSFQVGRDIYARFVQ
jgi:putative copper export protein